MPNIASTKKRLRQSVVRRARNRAAKSAIRTQIKKVRAAITAGDSDKAKTEFAGAIKKLDKAAGKNLIHKNTTARIKSRITAAIKKIGTAATAAK